MCFFCGLCFCGCFFLSLLRIIFGDRILSKYKKCCGTYVPQHFYICISLFYFNYPAFGSFDSAHLNSGESIVELLDGRTHLIHTRREANFLAVVDISRTVFSFPIYIISSSEETNAVFLFIKQFLFSFCS